MVQRIIELEEQETVELIDLPLSEEQVEVPEPVTNQSSKASYGRPAGARAFMWDGTETTIVLAWDIHGKTHDGGRRYLSKKHCLCCGFSGFLEHCTKCRKETCSRCRSGNDRKEIIPAIYLKESDVPFPQLFYGNVNCFLPTCTRKEDRGFRSLEEMHMHAVGRHTAEWEAHQTAQQSRETSQVDLLQQQITTLTAHMLAENAPVSPPAEEPTKQRRTRAKKEPATGTPEAPLYNPKGA